jgi:hypothetical protein
MRKISVLILLVLSVVVGVNAQGKNATLTATVLDENKALLRGASVTLTNVDTKAAQKCVSDEKGQCKFEASAGTYELAAYLNGGTFCQLKSDLRLKESETIPVELKLVPCKWKDSGEYEKFMKSLGR